METEGYYIKENGEKKILLSCDQYVSKSIYRYEYYDFIVCLGYINSYIEFKSQIVELELPSGYTTLFCDGNMLKKLTINNTKRICCNDNNIEEIIINHEFRHLDLGRNPIKHITINNPIYNPDSTIILDVNAQINPFNYPNLNLNFY